MALIQPPQKRGEPEVKPEMGEIGFRYPVALTRKMRYHKPRQKALWVQEAVEDLLNLSSYKDVDWGNPVEEECDAFLSMLYLAERYTELGKSTALRLPVTVINDLNTAAERIEKVTGRTDMRSLIVRAALRQRILFQGRRIGDVLPDVIDGEGLQGE